MALRQTAEQREIDVDAMAAGDLGDREDEAVLQEGGEVRAGAPVLRYGQDQP